MTRKVLILHAPGTNRDGDLAHAIRAAGGEPQIVPLSTLAAGGVRPEDFAMLALPGGFSYGDALGAGRIWALEMATTFAALLDHFVGEGKAVIGICNGFQALVKAGALPDPDRKATLTFNRRGHFECRWVTLAPNPANASPWLAGLDAIDCPVAHGEGRFIQAEGQGIPLERVALFYAGTDGVRAAGEYPANPNGSPLDIAGVTNRAGNVLGLMPHPENHIHHWQHPSWTRGGRRRLGVRLFANGLENFG